MNSTIYASALKNTIGEIKNICPEVSETFVFKDSDIIAKTDSSSKKTLDQAIFALNSIEKEAKTVCGIKSIRIEGKKGKINLINMEKFNFATVLTNEADEKYVNTLTRVLVPTVIKLVDNIQLNLPKIEVENKKPYEPVIETPKTVEKIPDLNVLSVHEAPLVELIEVPASEQVQITEEIQDTQNDLSVNEAPIVELIEVLPSEKVQIAEEIPDTEFLKNEFQNEIPKIELEDDTFFAEPPVTQLIVEKLSGLLVSSDTVRIDKEIIEKWSELYEGKKIEMLYIENINGKNTQSKFRNIKSSKYAGKGVIRIPEKIQFALETSKGELVTIKPVIS